MKYQRLLLAIVLIFKGVWLSAQSDSSSREVLGKIYIDTVLLGDLNNDKIIDTAFVLTPRTLDTYDENGELEFTFGCENDSCYNSVRFSIDFPGLRVENSVWGEIENAGDLNGDGFAEILFCNGWFTSAWTSLNLYTLKDRKWVQLTGASIRRDDELLTSRLFRKKGEWYLLGDQFKDDDFVTYDVLVPKF